MDLGLEVDLEDFGGQRCLNIFSSVHIIWIQKPFKNNIQLIPLYKFKWTEKADQIKSNPLI
jgi:hypothetical protein